MRPSVQRRKTTRRHRKSRELSRRLRLRVRGLVVAGQDVQTPGSGLVRIGLIATVLLSIFAHGLSASPGIRLYAQ